MVGDRYLTDVVYGNRLGMLTLRTQPLTLRGEPKAVLLVQPSCHTAASKHWAWLHWWQANLSLWAEQVCLHHSAEHILWAQTRKFEDSCVHRWLQQGKQVLSVAHALLWADYEWQPEHTCCWSCRRLYIP